MNQNDPAPQSDRPAAYDSVEHDAANALGRGKPAKPESLSHLLMRMAGDTTLDRVSVDDLIKALGVRAFGALILIFALPNVIPAPPGTSAILGLPLLFLTAQMMLGKQPWLPAPIARRSMPHEDFARLVSRAAPYLERAEKLLVPRMSFLASPWAERGLGLFTLVLAIVLFLPIPLGNMLPAFSISVVSLGLLERDGMWIIGGVAIGIASLFIVAGVVWAMAMALVFLLGSLFS